jgi:L-ascorbate metabolism protein UlaG (beta-lactamase superfamily)
LKTKKRYNVLILLLLAAFLIPLSETTKSDPAPNTTSDSLHNIGHASMKIKTVDGKVIYVDPFAPGDYSDSADIILVTHGHSDHNQINLVTQKQKCTVITYVESNISGVYQSFDVDGIKIYSVAAYNQNHNKNQCVGYVIEFNGIKLYHAGDTGNIPEMAELADSNVTYALLPVDGIFTMSPEDATDASNMIRAIYSIPIHTEPPPDNYNEDIVARFTPNNRLLVRNGETIALMKPATDVENNTKLLSNFRLYQSYPNPFNPVTKINFSIPLPSFVTLKVFDVKGSEVSTIVSEQLPGGIYSKEWNASDMPSGVYFYRIETGNFTDTKKFVLLK